MGLTSIKWNLSSMNSSTYAIIMQNILRGKKMNTLIFSGSPSLLDEIKILVKGFVKEKGEKINVIEDEYYSPAKYTSLDELRADYAQRIDDIKSGKDKLTPFNEGLDDLMKEVESELKNENFKIHKIS